MLPYPDIDPVAVSLGPIQVHWYGLAYLAGLAFAWWLGVRRSRRPDVPLSREQVDGLPAAAISLSVRCWTWRRC